MSDGISGFHVQSYNEEDMKSQAYGVYSGCRVYPNLFSDVHSLTSFGPGVDRLALVDVSLPWLTIHTSCWEMLNGTVYWHYCMVILSIISSLLHLLCCFQPVDVSRYYAPLFVLTPEQLATAQPTMVLGGASWLLSSEEEVLFCSYCVSSSKKWLLATCSNKHGEILNTSVIEIHTAKQVYLHVHVQMKTVVVSTNCIDYLICALSHSKSYFCSSRSLALQKLWRYCMSVVGGSILRWSVVITRVGNPGWGEIAG